MARAVRVSGCSGPETRSRMGSRAAYWSRAPAASPASPVQWARLSRVARVSGCSGPGPARGWAAGRRTGRGPRPRPPPPRSSGRGWRGRSGCRGARGPGPARGWAAGRRTGRGPRPRPPPPRSSGRGCARAVRVSGCSGPETRSRMGSRAANWSRAPAASPAFPVQRARFVAGGQGVGVLGAVVPAVPVRVGDQREHVPGRRVAAAVPEAERDLPDADAGQVQDGAGVRQQQRARPPRARQAFRRPGSPPRLWPQQPAPTGLPGRR